MACCKHYKMCIGKHALLLQPICWTFLAIETIYQIILHNRYSSNYKHLIEFQRSFLKLEWLLTCFLDIRGLCIEKKTHYFSFYILSTFYLLTCVPNKKSLHEIQGSPKKTCVKFWGIGARGWIGRGKCEGANVKGDHGV